MVFLFLDGGVMCCFLRDDLYEPCMHGETVDAFLFWSSNVDVWLLLIAQMLCLL
jgi:hypothetical protein